MDDPAKNPVGRPTKYDPKMGPEVIRWMAMGYSKEAAAAAIGISKPTFYVYISEYPEFSNAVKEGEQQNLLFWEGAGLAGMHADKFSSATWIFNMKNRFKWSDRQEIVGDAEKPLEVNHHVDAMGLDELKEAFSKAKGTD